MSRSAGIYVRISSDPTGKSLGVQRQESDCKALAARLGWTVADTYIDNDTSAYSGKRRPEYERMLADIATKRIDGVLTWHPDRLYRRAADMAGFIAAIESAGIEVRTVTAGSLDLSTASGRMTARILGDVAIHEVEHARERMVAAHKQAALAGKWRSRPRMFGYAPGGKSVVEVEAQAIRSAANDLLLGVSLGEIVRRWNRDDNLHTAGHATRWDSAKIRLILRNPTYAGLVHYHGEVVGKGEWEAILDETTHRAVVGLFEGRRTGTTKSRMWQGSGVYRCGVCDAPMTTGGTREDKLYKCSERAHVSRRAIYLDEYIDALIIARLSAPDAHLVLDTPEIDLSALRGKRDALQVRLDTLATMFAAGDLTGSQLKAGTAQLRADIDAIDKQAAQAAHRNPLADLVIGAGELIDRWEALSPERRGKIVTALMVVSVLPSPRGQRKFQPECIRVEWKQ